MLKGRKELGAKGEKIAEKYLRKKGMRPVQRNLRRKAGEIDLLMMDKDELVIVEVRTVQESYGFDASDRISPGKRKQLIRVAKHLLSELPDPLPPVRFDICVITMNQDVTIEHIDAFRPD